MLRGKYRDFPMDSAQAHPPSLFPDYKSTLKRAPKQPLIILPHTETELNGPAYGHESVTAGDADLTRQHAGEPLGERIIVRGRVLDEDGRAIPMRWSRSGRPMPPAATCMSVISTMLRSIRISPAPDVR